MADDRTQTPAPETSEAASPELSKPNRGVALAQNFGLLLATVVGFALILEVTLRLSGFSFVLYPEDIEFGRPDPVLLEKAFLEDDELFWVTRDYPEKLARLAEERPPWILMGDSCTHLGRYDQAVVRWVEQQGAAAPRFGNLGVAGWSSAQGRRQLERDVVPLAPKVVTIYYGWNDHWIGFGIEDKTIARLKRIFSSRWSGLRSVQLVSKAAVAWGAKDTAYPNRVSLDDFRDNHRAMVRTAREAGIEPVLITAATSHREGEEPAHLTQRWLRDLSDLVPLHQRYVEVVRKVAAEEGAVLCDAAAELDDLPRAEQQRLFLDDGIHFTPEGDTRLGEIVGRCLDDAGLLERLLDTQAAKAP